MSDEILIQQKEEGVFFLTLNRPEKRNALNGNIIQLWLQAFDTLAEDKRVRVVVIQGNGKHFCAGADIAWMQKMSQSSHEDNVKDALTLAALFKKMSLFPKPLIALVQGAVMGGGLGVVACCDIVIAEEQAEFCFSEVKIGLAPSVISPYIIPIIGARAARYYFLTAEKFDAKTAAALHLVQKIVPREKLEEAGMQLVHVLLNNSPHALDQVKAFIRRINSHPISSELMQWTAEHLSMMRTSEEAREGLNAFLEKRTPSWSLIKGE